MDADKNIMELTRESAEQALIEANLSNPGPWAEHSRYVALAYPIYNKVLKKEREKIAPEILRLSDELLK